MPAPSPPIGNRQARTLRELGQHLRDRRKGLGVSAVTAAEAAGMSRITLFRIEKGEPSVTLGAYLNLVTALGLDLDLQDRQTRKARPKSLPTLIRLNEFPQLKRLAWQLKDTTELSPEEALALYERNWRHVDTKAMGAHERAFLQDLLSAFGRERLLV